MSLFVVPSQRLQKCFIHKLYVVQEFLDVTMHCLSFLSRRTIGSEIVLILELASIYFCSKLCNFPDNKHCTVTILVFGHFITVRWETIPNFFFMLRPARLTHLLCFTLGASYYVTLFLNTLPHLVVVTLAIHSVPTRLQLYLCRHSLLWVLTIITNFHISLFVFSFQYVIVDCCGRSCLHHKNQHYQIIAVG